MGFKETYEGDGGKGGGRKAFSLSSSGNVSCSICLESVTDTGERSWAKLLCGHEFHLDCIGSAFNSKGAMQCPNCRKIEKGQWNYASGSHSFTDYIEDWPHDEDTYDLNYAEMFGVQWCPLPGFSQLPHFEEGDVSSTAYQELMGQHAIFAEQMAVSSTAHQCPYVAYYGPLHSPSLNTAGSLSDGPNFSNRLGGPSGQSEHQISYTMEPHNQGWEHHSMPFLATGGQLGASDQPSSPFVNQRPSRANADLLRPGSHVHPSVVSHSSGNRVRRSMTSSMVPPYPGSAARARDRVQALQAYFQPPSTSSPPRTPLTSFVGSRRSNVHRGVSQVGPQPSSSGQSGGFYVLPSATSSRSFIEAANANQFHGWESVHPERDSSSAPHPHPTVGAPNCFPQRHGSEQSPPHSRS